MRLRNRTYGEEPVKVDQQMSSVSKVCNEARQQTVRNPVREPLQSEHSKNISESDFSCHCCYEILLNPTTLSCGHNFCRHCLAQWWKSSRKNKCPECREKWEDFPQTNVLLRDATDKIFREAVNRRKAEIESSRQISRTLSAFQRFGNNLRQRTEGNQVRWSFGYGVLTVLASVVVLMLLYHGCSGGCNQQKKLSRKAVSLWTTEELGYWMEQMGPWTQPYRKHFLQKKVNGRLLLIFGEEQLINCLYRIDNKTHQKALLAEFNRVKTLDGQIHKGPSEVYPSSSPGPTYVAKHINLGGETADDKRCHRHTVVRTTTRTIHSSGGWPQVNNYGAQICVSWDACAEAGHLGHRFTHTMVINALSRSDGSQEGGPSDVHTLPSGHKCIL